MKCPGCNTENPDTRKFCRECGTKLVLVCINCGFENFPGDKFQGDSEIHWPNKEPEGDSANKNENWHSHWTCGGRNCRK